MLPYMMEPVQLLKQLLAIESTRRDQILVSETVHPDTRKVLSTFMNHRGFELITIPMKNGVTDIDTLKNYKRKYSCHFDSNS